MQKRGLVTFGVLITMGFLIIPLLSVSFVSASALDQLCEAAGNGPGCVNSFQLPDPVPIAEASDTADTANTQQTGGINFPFLSNLYKGKTYTNEELVAFGKAIPGRADVIEAIRQADKHCKNTGAASCSDWMDSNTCSNYQEDMEESRLADCDYGQVVAAAKAAYEASLTPVNPEGSIETQRCQAGRAFDGSKCDSSTDVVLTDNSAPAESALTAAIEATTADQQAEASKESALTAAIEATAADQVSKGDFTPAEVALGDIMLNVGGTSTVKELVDWQPISDRTLAYAKMKLLEEQTMCVQSIEPHCETAKDYLSTVDKLTQAKAEQEKAEQAKKASGRLITVRDRFGKIVLQFGLMIQRLFGNGFKGSSYTPAP